MQNKNNLNNNIKQSQYYIKFHELMLVVTKKYIYTKQKPVI